jgi:Na+/proline symporter
MPLVARAVLPPLLGALLLAIASAIMSTVSALMLVAGSALARDLYGTFARRHPSVSGSLWAASVSSW